MENSKPLKRTLLNALIALLIAFLAVTVATFAWYIYNTRAHTTDVHMAAGAGVTLQISDEYDGPYSSAAVLDAFVSSLNPVSTDNILNGFQKVQGFTNGSENQPLLVANLFGRSADSDFYKTTLYFRTNADEQDVYLADITYEDSDENNPISTAIRVGFVAHDPGRDQPEDPEKMYIFIINDEENPGKEYNTFTGYEGCVLDSTKDDGTTVFFEPYDKRNFCSYNSATGVTTLTRDSLPLFSVEGDRNSEDQFGRSVQLDVYIWLEGCDEDCTNTIRNTTLRNLALVFAASDAE